MILASCQTERSPGKAPSITATLEIPELQTAFPMQTAKSSISTPSGELSATEINDRQPDSDIPNFSSGSKVEISFAGPASTGLDPENNPYALQVDVQLSNPNGEMIVVPAFYDGDGASGIDGDIWKLRFSPHQTGVWHYNVSSENEQLNGYQGSFKVEANTDCGVDFSSDDGLACKGRLEYVGEHYLQFQDGTFWIKAGLDDPENFLGTAFGDWEAKRGQIDLLSQMGINSIYVITNNIDGDRKDTWPWVGDTPAEAKSNHDRFDVAKLQAWEDFFSYVQQKGIVLHLVLNDDSAWSGYDESLYFREMVARFGHHPGIIWNIGEEANEIYSNNEQISYANMVKEIDPYDHPVTVHRKSPWPFLGNQSFDLTSIQIGDGASGFSTARLADFNKIVLGHREQSAQQGHPIPIMIDETPRITEVNPQVREKFRTQVLYPIFLGGGNFELHYRDAYGQGGLVTIEDLRPLIMDMVLLRSLLESMPFVDMQPCNQLLSNPSNFCFGDRDSDYVIYYPEGGPEYIDLTQDDVDFTAAWFNPQTGELIDSGLVQGGELILFTPPGDGDWVLLLRKA